MRADRPFLFRLRRLLRLLPRVSFAYVPFAYAVAWSLAAPEVAAQGLTVSFVPSAVEVTTCPDVRLTVELRLENPSRLEVGGFQAFLRYPAKHFEAVAYESGDFGGHHEAAKPADPGGFRPCDGEGLDGWSDLAGEDIVAVVAGAYEKPGSVPFSGAAAVLGRFAFRPRGAATDAGGARFLPNEESCHPPFEQTTKVFGKNGETLALAGAPSGFTVNVEDGGPAVEAFTCSDRETSVLLVWRGPSTDTVSGYRIYRNGELLAEYLIRFIDSHEDKAPPAGIVRYDLAVLRRGAEGPVEGCRASCELERRPQAAFKRGDTDRDNRLSITDGIWILESLFAGRQIPCRDAADADDNGRVELTDAIRLLSYLFRSGAAPPPPFPDPGPDPTVDDLTCER